MLSSLGAGLVGAILNRMRGGMLKEWGWTDSTWWCRLAWAAPTGILLFFLTTPDTEMWYRIILLIGSSLASWALWGSGAHSIMNKDLWVNAWKAGSNPDITELYTTWLPRVINPPTIFSPEEDFWKYHIVGKSTEGILRMLTMCLPLLIVAPWAAVKIILAGLAWGPIYWLSWQISDTKGWVYGEWATGFWTWFTIVWFFTVW